MTTRSAPCAPHDASGVLYGRRLEPLRTSGRNQRWANVVLMTHRGEARRALRDFASREAELQQNRRRRNGVMKRAIGSYNKIEEDETE